MSTDDFEFENFDLLNKHMFFFFNFDDNGKSCKILLKYSFMCKPGIVVDMYLF